MRVGMTACLAGTMLALALAAGEPGLAGREGPEAPFRRAGTLDARPKSEIRFRLLAYEGPLVIRSAVPDGEAARVPIAEFEMEGVRGRLDAARKEREALLEEMKRTMSASARQALLAKEREIFLLRVDEEEMRIGARTARQGTVRHGPAGLRAGQTVHPGALFATVQDESSLQIEIPVTVRDAEVLEPGLPARVTFLGIPDLALDGVVERAAPEVKRFPGTSDQTWRVAEEVMGETQTLRIGIPAKDPRLKPGLACIVEIRAPRGDEAPPEDVPAVLADLYARLGEWYALLDEIAALRVRIDPEKGSGEDPRRPVPPGILAAWVPGKPLPEPVAGFLGLTASEREAVDAALRDEAEAFRAALARLGPPKDARDPMTESHLRAFGMLPAREPGREPTLFDLVRERQGRGTRTTVEVWQHGVPEALGVKDFFCKEAVFGAGSSEAELWGALEGIRLDTYKRLQPALRADRYVMLTRLFGRFGFQAPAGGGRVSSNNAFHPRLIATWKGGLAHFRQDVAHMRREVEKMKAAQKQ